MNPAIPARRGKFHGVTRIVALNCHWYVAGMCTVAAAAFVLIVFNWPGWLRVAVFGGTGVAIVWSTVSLIVSHWVYDRSNLREWRWIEQALSLAPRRWCQLHCGLDESSAPLRKLFPDAEGVVLDIFNAAEMTEPSIARARAGAVRGPSRTADFRRLPLPSSGLDAVFLFFAAHELRRGTSRAQLFAEVRRVLRPGGEVIVAEHLRDAANLCAFGPGAFHFFSRSDWLSVFANAGLALRRESRITPFVRMFVLGRNA